MKSDLKRPLALGALVLLLAGCGQTGPLYMPSDEEARERYDPQEDYDISEPTDEAIEAEGIDVDSDSIYDDAGLSASVPDADDSAALDDDGLDDEGIGSPSGVPNINSMSAPSTNPVGGPRSVN